MPNDQIHHAVDTLIIGAGLAGLSAANDLQQAGHNVLLVDKGRGLGGRLAGRRIGKATFDHGAQFMTTRDQRFASTVQHWVQIGVAEEWYSSYPGSSEQSSGHPRYRGVPTMTAIAKHLANDLNILRSVRVLDIAQQGNKWLATLDNGETVIAKSMLITSPIPQTLELLASGNIPLSSDQQARLDRIEYEACMAVMAVLDGPSTIPAPGAIAPQDGPISWLADNQQKGVSTLPAVTIHGSAAFSLEHFDEDRQIVGQQLIDAAQPFLGANVTEFQVHGWRYSKPSVVDPEACMLVSSDTPLPPLVLAGDAFDGPRVEGAVVSGWAAAAVLAGLL
jgi:renalase